MDRDSGLRCNDCGMTFHDVDPGRCSGCGSGRLVPMYVSDGGNESEWLKNAERQAPEHAMRDQGACSAISQIWLHAAGKAADKTYRGDTVEQHIEMLKAADLAMWQMKEALEAA